MGGKIKNFFSFFAKKKPFLLVFFFVILGIFYPLKPALAVWDWLVGAINLIPAVSISLIALFVASIASLLAALGGLILNYVISPSFTTLSYTNPAGNKLIEVGLGITQGFANMLLVLVLVYIAIATILRLAGYETKKLLVTFIIVALLVNFSPVICGLIVDASNIVMNFFLSELTGSKQLINSFGAIWEVIKEGFSWKKAFTFTGQLDTIFNFLILTVVNLALFLVLLLFAVIFMYRYIAIWILVILSPLAFICYILPATRKYWTLWWNQLIQWSIIGITCGFFLYLAEFLTSMGTSVYGTASGPGSSILPHLVPLGFLIMGLVYGLKTSAMGASSVISLTKKYGKKTGIYGAAGVGALYRQAISSKLAEKYKLKERLTKQSRIPLPGFKGKSLVGKAATAAGYATGVIPAYWAARRGIGQATLRITEAETKDVKTAEDKYKDTTADRKASAIRDVRLTPSHRIAALNQAVEEGQIGDVKKLLGKTADEEIKKIGKAALKIHPEIFKKIRDAFPHLAEEMGKGFSETTKENAGLAFKDDAEKEMYGNSITAKIIAKVKPANIPKMDIEGIFKLPPDDKTRGDIEATMHKFWTGEQVGAAARNFGRAFMEPFIEMVKVKGKNWYKTNNPRLGTYLDSSAARGLGLELP